MPDDRTSCWTQSQRNKDPFLKAWMDEIPKTIPEKAVWEFDRSTSVFKPYLWNGLNLNQTIPHHEVDNIFANIRNQLKPHPKNMLNIIVLSYLFFVHLPVLIIGLIWLTSVTKSTTKQDQTGPVMIFIGIVLTTTTIMLIMAFTLKCKYVAALDKRERDLKGLLDAVSTASLFKYKIRAVGGDKGAWVELQFLDPSVYMTAGYLNEPSPHAHGYHQPLLYNAPQFG